MSNRVRFRWFLGALVCLVVNAATWALGTWWAAVGVACGVVAAAMAVARPHFVDPASKDVEAGEGGRG